MKESPMHVAIVSPTGFTRGAFTRMNELALGVVESGHEVVWFGPQVRYELPGVRYVLLRKRRIDSLGLGFSRMARREIKKLVSNIDVFLAFRELDVALFRPIAKKFGKPIVYFSRADTLANDFLNIESAVNGIDRAYACAQALSHLGLRKRALEASDVIVVQTPALKDQMRFVSPMTSKRFLVLPNNSNPSWVTRNMLAWKGIKTEGKTVIGYIGRVRVGRGLEDLVDAVAGLGAGVDVEVRIFGPDIYGAREIRARPEIKGIKNMVRFMGETDRALEEMAKMDVIVANRYVDHCPNTVLEAMAVGTPIIATAIPAHRFILGDAGILYEPGRVEELTALLSRVVNGGLDLPSLSAKLSERGKKFVFPWRRVAAEIVVAAAEGRGETLRLSEIAGWPEGLV